MGEIYRAKDLRPGREVAVNVLPFRPLHGDPRWGAFFRKMGFET